MSQKHRGFVSLSQLSIKKTHTCITHEQHSNLSYSIRISVLNYCSRLHFGCIDSKLNGNLLSLSLFVCWYPEIWAGTNCKAWANSSSHPLAEVTEIGTYMYLPLWAPTSACQFPWTPSTVPEVAWLATPRLSRPTISFMTKSAIKQNQYGNPWRPWHCKQDALSPGMALIDSEAWKSKLGHSSICFLAVPCLPCILVYPFVCDERHVVSLCQCGNRSCNCRLVWLLDLEVQKSSSLF